MALFGTPEEHAANGPETWTITGSGRNWWLRTKDGDRLSSHRSKREATYAREIGWTVKLYRDEGRWFAGESVNGWKPYEGASKPEQPAPSRFDVLQALSLARTALDDPGAVPEQELTPITARTYAIDRIDESIGALYYEPENDARGEAAWVLTHLGRLLSAVADRLDDSAFPSSVMVAAAAHIDAACDRIDEAIALVEPKGETETW
jgi:hypothetical protein